IFYIGADISEIFYIGAIFHVSEILYIYIGAILYIKKAVDNYIANNHIKQKMMIYMLEKPYAHYDVKANEFHINVDINAEDYIVRAMTIYITETNGNYHIEQAINYIVMVMDLAAPTIHIVMSWIFARTARAVLTTSAMLISGFWWHQGSATLSIYPAVVLSRRMPKSLATCR
ncbi:unnamed protein product, partial [Symbiodinium sp. CCMP2456]